MTKIVIKISDELHEVVKMKSEETGIPYSVIVRRALENWVATGIVPARVASPATVPAVGSGEG